MRAYGLSDIGLVREENEDSFAIKMFDGDVFAVLCDGMGGESAGKEASEIACSVMLKKFEASYSPNFTLNSLRNLLFSCVNAANSMVYATAESDPAKTGMGTTCVGVFAKGGNVLVVNVGDSRAYVVGENSITQITDDHTVVRMLVENGDITEEEAAVHPQQSCLTMAVGVEKTISPDYFEVTIGKDEMILLCSDGLTRYCTDEEISAVIKCSSIENIPKLLVEKAKERGGRDNITVVVFSE